MERRTLLIIFAAVLVAIVLIGVLVFAMKGKDDTTAAATTNKSSDTANDTTSNFMRVDENSGRRSKRALKYDFDAEEEEPHSADTDGKTYDKLDDLARTNAVPLATSVKCKKREDTFRFDEPIKSMLMGITVKGKQKTPSTLNFYDIEGNSYLQLKLDPKENSVTSNWVVTEDVLSKNWPQIWFISIGNGLVTFNSKVIYELPTYFPKIYYLKIDTPSPIEQVYLSAVNGRNISPTNATSVNYKIKQLKNINANPDTATPE